LTPQMGRSRSSFASSIDLRKIPIAYIDAHQIN
jgi:hypothetical protein